MKKTILYLSLLVLAACGNKKNIPDVSDVAVAVSIERFDKAFFKIDSNHI